MVLRSVWCREVSLVRHWAPVLEVNTEMSSLAIGFFTVEIAAFYSLFPKMFTHKWSEEKNNGLLKAAKGCSNYPKSWYFVYFSSFLTAIWALPHVQVSSLCSKALFFCLLAHLMRKASFSVTSGKAQTSVPGPELQTLSPGSPGSTKATSTLTSTTPLTGVELLRFLRSLNKYIKAGYFLSNIHIGIVTLCPCAIPSTPSICFTDSQNGSGWKQPWKGPHFNPSTMGKDTSH